MKNDGFSIQNTLTWAYTQIVFSVVQIMWYFMHLVPRGVICLLIQQRQLYSYQHWLDILLTLLTFSCWLLTTAISIIIFPELALEDFFGISIYCYIRNLEMSMFQKILHGIANILRLLNLLRVKKKMWSKTLLTFYVWNKTYLQFSRWHFWIVVMCNFHCPCCFIRLIPEPRQTKWHLGDLFDLL